MLRYFAAAGVFTLAMMHQTSRHMWRRLKEDRNQHYEDLTCLCWTNPRIMASFKEQPATCSSPFCCGNPRRLRGKRTETLTMQERRHLDILLDAC